MSEKITESQIYLFLADYGDKWKDDADKLDKEDGKVSKYEFKQFLSLNWTGVNASQLSHSVIDNFFAKIDTNNVGNSNFNILDKTELTNMESAISAYEALNEFLKDKCNTDFPNTGLNNKYMNSWKWDLSDALTATINNCIANGISDKNQIKSELAEPYKQAFATATANCFVAQYTDPQNGEFKSLLSGLNYSFEEDSMFQNIVTECVTSIAAVEPGKDGAQQIADKIKTLVKDYMAAASLKSGGNAENLKQYNSYNESRLNDLQKARLGQVASDALKEKLTSIDVKDRNGKKIDLTKTGYAEIFQKATTEFVNWYTSTGYKSVSTTSEKSLFAAIEADLAQNAPALFEKSSAYSNFLKEVQMTDSYILIDENKDFYAKLKEAGLNDEQLTKIKEQNLPEYNNAYNDILKEILNGNSTYLNADGSINFDAVDLQLIETLKVKLGIVKINTEQPVTPESKPVQTSINWAALNDNNYSYDGSILSFDGDRLGKLKEANSNIAYFYNSNGYLNLLNGLNCNEKGFTGGDTASVENGRVHLQKGVDIDGAISTAKNNFTNFIDSVNSACSASGNYDNSALAEATDKIKTLYNKAFDSAKSTWNVKDKHVDNTFRFGDKDYTYHTGNGKREKNMSATKKDLNNSLGLAFIISWNDPRTYQIALDPKVVLNLFNQFYQQALSK